ncbi:FtsX-like permease family protein [Leucobacter luti]|uniref:FtsX-like permease family protein n=1 Tax=Leucobacter luti TaxID=340320 RepID=A0A4R6RTI7_9MICO|nr:ABC transporter permease [Leucobacter luti]TDP90170.1 FtsX-like permease family protein [Leucobacter luti]
MYWTMLRREPGGRKRQTIVVAAGLAIAIALVIVVSALSAGIRQAQSAALERVAGVGTDLTVTGAAPDPGSGDGPGGGGPRFEFGAEAGTTSDGTTSIAQSRLSTDRMRGTLAAAALTTVQSIDGVAAATGVLSLTNTSFSGEMPASAAESGADASGAPSGGPGGGAGGPGGAGGSSFDVNSFTVFGIDPTATAVGPLTGVALNAGRLLTAADNDVDADNVAVLDAAYAASADLALGDTVAIGSGTAEVVGIVSSTTEDTSTAANVYLALETAKALADSGEVVSTIYVAADSAATAEAVQQAIETELPDATVSSQADLAAQVSGSLASASSLISSLGTWLSLIVLAVALAIAILLTNAGVQRRTREFGTLKAIGWSNGRVVRQIAGESLVQALLGGAVGIALGIGAIWVVNLIGITLPGGATAVAGDTGGPDAPDDMAAGGPGGGFGRAAQAAADTADIVLHAPITPWIVGAALALSLLGGVLAGAFGAWRAVRLSPIEALRTIS